MTIKTILQRKGSKVFTIAPEMTIAEVARDLNTHRIGAVVIMQDERLVGILSERDIVRCLAEKGAAALTERVENVMTRKVEVCGLDDTANSAMERMSAARFRHMPVVEDGRLIGIVSIGDVVKKRIDDAERERDDMRAYIHNT